MTVSELIKELNKFDSNLDVGGIGHFAELLNINDIRLYKQPYTSIDGTREEFIVLDIDDKGPEPD